VITIAYSPLVESSLIFSHIIPPILAFIGIIMITTGIMDSNNRQTLLGVLIFLIAGLSPFVILPLLLG
jgi:predicted membrane channel-forming protein YqfA (hemolysin III family)